MTIFSKTKSTLPLWVLAVFVAVGALLLSCSGENKTDVRTESVRLPSGAILENSTYYESEWDGGFRHNKLFLKDPVRRTSELIGDVSYRDNLSLFAKFPKPQEFARGEEKTLLIGPYVCKRWDRKGPWWYVECFETAGNPAYLQSFIGGEPLNSAQYTCDQLDPEENILTVKKTRSNEKYPSPDYLVYSALKYEYPWRFDLMRTKAKNGPSWEKPKPFPMALDFSVITFQKPSSPSYVQCRERSKALAYSGGKEIFSTTIELSDKELRSAECRFTMSNGAKITEKIEAMYGFATFHTNQFCIVWQPHDPAAWPIDVLTLDVWTEVNSSGFVGNLQGEQFIRLRRIEP